MVKPALKSILATRPAGLDGAFGKGRLRKEEKMFSTYLRSELSFQRYVPRRNTGRWLIIG